MKTFEAEDRANGGEEGGFKGTVLNRGAGKVAQAEEPKFQSFGGAGVSLGGAPAISQQQPQLSQEEEAMMAQYGDDPELLAAIQASMTPTVVCTAEPAADCDPALVCEVQLRCPDGSTLRRRFHREKDTLQDILNYFKVEKKETSNFNLMAMRKVISTPDNLSKSLAAMNIGKREAFIVTN